MTKPSHLVRLLAAFLTLSSVTTARAIIDDFSTGPGQGSPDTLDDVWQTLYNGWGLSPSGDEDNDGCSNFVESVAGSDPRNPGDCLTVGNMVIGATNIIMNFDGKRGKVYQVWQSDNPGGAAPGEPGSPWSELAGASKEASADGADSIVFPKPAGSRKFYRLESKDADADNDGVSDWAEHKLGTDVNLATSPNNASGGAASDGDTLRSLMSLTITTGSADAFEKEGTPATIQLKRTFGTMPLTVSLDTLPGATSATKSSADASHYMLKNMADVATSTVTLPANQGNGTPYSVAKVVPVQNNVLEVPRALKVCLRRPGVPNTVTAPEVTVNVKDADPTVIANRQLYVAFLGREADVISTASGYATALVDGDNNKASISITFNNLSSEQNTAYIRVGSDLEVLPLPLGQVSGANWSIRAAQTEVTDQAMLNALKDGRLYVAISTANNPVKEIWGYFNRAIGSTTFDDTRDDLVAPALGDSTWPVPTDDALEREIWRFMGQATFGGTTALYNEIRAEVDAAISGGGTYLTGLSNWLDKQMDPVQSPQISLQQLVMAADMEEFALRGNKPITYNSDPQLNGGSYGVSFVNGMPVGNVSTVNTNDPGQNSPSGNNSDSPNKRREWWTMITQSKDHVRQRVAQALHEICVISERDATVLQRGHGAANYWDMIAAGAFGKYRTLLEKVSLHPMMGVYLTSVANRARYETSAGSGIFISPDENYAREIMQLFSIGLILRHPDGSLQLSGEGLPIATYDNNDITELARVFTGFSHGARNGNATTQVLQQNGTVGSTTQAISPTVFANGASSNYTWFGRNDGHLYWQTPWTTPMKVVGKISAPIITTTTVYHDFNTYSYLDVTQDPPVQTPVPGVSKRLLAGKHGQLEIPTPPWDPMTQTDAVVNAKSLEEVKAAHNCLAGVETDSVYGAGTQTSPGHTNTPVNISRWLIQRLVTSNPSAGYIYRVQKAFRDNNGTLGPVVKAILLDHEARSLTLADSLISHGKVKEPLVHFASILRQFRAYSGAPVAALRDMTTGFSDLDAPMSGGLAAGEVAKFNSLNLSPPSKPASWPDGPFRFRIDSLRSSLGQSPQDSPSVFNWFLPDFQPAGTFAQNGLFAPELQISNEANEVAKVNFLYNYTWMTLAGMSATPGISGADFVFRNGWATPAARVSINGGTSFLGLPPTITLNETNWNTGVTVTLAPINDQKIDQIAASTVRFTSTATATGYAGISIPSLPVTWVENEKKNESLVIVQSGGNTYVQEGGATDTIGIYLSCPPAEGSIVTVAIGTQNGQVSVSPASLTFDNSNWNTAQTMTVTANDDAAVEDAGTGNDLITLTTTSTNANFDGIVTTPLLVGVTDNDSALGVLITQGGGSTDVTETSTSSPLGSTGMDSYTIVLTKAPTANVVVNCVSNGQLGINGPPSGTNNTTQSTTFTTSTTTRTFTTTNWNVPQTVWVRGNNDTTSEGPHTGTVTHSISAASGGYPTTLPIQQVIATIADDDNSIIVTQTGNDTRVMEGGEVTDTILVRLRTAPNGPVSVVLGGLGLKFSPAQLNFNPTGSASALWNAEQIVTVSALDDFLNSGIRSVNIIAYSTSAGTNYNGTTAPNVPCTIIDNDDARLVITETNGGTAVNEDGTTDTYTLALGRRPKAGSTTTVTMVVGSGITISPPGPIVFTDSNWNTPVTITVAASNDSSAETRLTATIIHNISSTDPTYNVSSTPYLVVTIDDNDPPLTIAQTSTYTQVKEGGTAGTSGTPNVSDTFTVVLPRAPGATTPVTVTLVPNNQVTVSPTTLTFTSTNYTTAQTVTVTALDDTDVEATVHQGIIGFNITSNDAYYNGAQAPDVLVQVTDNDSPGISIVESSNITTPTEGGTDTYTVVLTQAPTSNVVIDLVSSDPIYGVTVSPATLTFTPAVSGTGSWATAQTVTVTAINDIKIEGRGTATITHNVRAGSDAAYVGLTPPVVTAILTDQIRANEGIVIAQTGGSTYIAEGGPTDSFDISLQCQPASDVTLNFATNTQITRSVNSMTFTPANWNIPQNVTLTAVDDTTVEGNHSTTFTVTAATPLLPLWNGISATSPTINIVDNERAGVIINHTGSSTDTIEGGATDTYTVVLSTAPNGNVVVNCSSASTTAGQTVSPTSLTFNATNWNVPRTVTVTAADDTTVENNHTSTISHSLSSASTTDNSGYAIQLTGVNTTATSTTVTCASTTGMYAGMLVSISGISSSATVSSVTNATTFVVSSAATATNTNITGKTLLTGLHTITDNITDNDNRIIVTQSGGSTMINENGTLADDYTVVLRSAPTAPVTVNLTVAANQGFVTSAASLSFDGSNWSVPQTVSITPADNGFKDRRHTTTITHASVSTDTNFNAQTIASVPVVVNTIDAPQIIEVESSGTTAVSESTTTDTYTLVLSQAPTDNVTVAINCDSQVTTTPSVLTFTPANWNVLQTVTVKAVDDYIVEPIQHFGFINPTVTSTDPVFNNMAVGQIVVQVTDNDSPHITFTQSGGTTVLYEKNATTDTYTVVLNTEPSADVVITIAPDAQQIVSVPTLTFTNSAGASPWNVPQTVTVTAVDDTTTEAVTHTGLITHSVASADPFYNNLSAPVITTQIWDNDSPSIDVQPVGGTDTVLTEGGANDSFIVKLNTQPEPGTSVTLTIYPPMFYVPPPQIGKTNGYFTNDQGSSNQRDNIVLDYTESILMYRSTFYNYLATAYGGTIPANLATSTNATDLANIQNAHWLATKTIIDKMDLWFSGGYLKAHWPILIEPNQPPPAPLPPFNPRQAVLDAIYRHSGGSGSPATTRYAAQVVYDPKAPPTSTFETDIRDRVRWSAYLMTVGATAFTQH